MTILVDRDVLILTSLAEGPKHGYAILKDIQAFSGENLTSGTLYGALARMEREGTVRSLKRDQRRHPYKITASGARALRKELTTSANVSTIGLARLTATGR